MLAGNWKTSRMVAYYSAGATAERGPWHDTSEAGRRSAPITQKWRSTQV